jgi:DNA invertase Pin-like site-specific DNA recombinase
MRVALYARYSSDNQREASIADQLRLCRERAAQHGWIIVEEYSDHATSGASMLRPGVQALMSDATRGRFDLILTESLDRLSRDQEDIAGLYKRMRFAGVKIVTLSEGEVGELHIGLKGTMGALYLRDLADKTRRGLRGRIEEGKSGGGLSYGYTVTRSLGPDGLPATGERIINEQEAAVVRRIFVDYADGKSPKRIALELNRDGIPAPGGGAWGFSTINGNVKRGNGILNNELYVGRMVWNRQRFLKDPETGKRVSRMNPQSEWIVHEVPHLRIIDDATWQAAKARQQRIRSQQDPGGREKATAFRDYRRPRYLFSGLTKCGRCGGGYSVISAHLLGCSTARNKGTCDNRINIRRDHFEERGCGR